MRMFTALIAGAAMLATGCGGGGDAATNAAGEADANIAVSEPANDASAMESVGTMTEEPPPAENMSNAAEAPQGETSGGDTGGNVMDNISGM